MKKFTILTAVSLALLPFLSCDRTHFDVFTPDELGMPEHAFYASNDGEDITIDYLSNKQGNITLMNPSDEEWLWLSTTAFGAEDGAVSVKVLKNDGFPRRADLLFFSDTRKDTVSVFQYGAIEEKVQAIDGTVLVLNGSTEASTATTDITIPLERIATEVRVSGAEDWITDCQLTQNSLSFKTTDNTDKIYMRRGLIALSYVDGWRNKQTELIHVVQARADNHIGTVFTPEQLRHVATVSGYTLPDDALVEGYIVSTTEGRNAGDAVVEDYRQGTGIIDYTLTDRTAYLESADGQYGFRLIADDEVHNEFKRYNRICLGLGGAVVKKSDSEPVCYTIEGVSSNNLINSIYDYDAMPKKEKSIRELTDNDLNTLVKIKNCEIAMRKGPFTPVNEGYAINCGYNRLAKYPTLIRDIEGGSMYMFTNMTCPYRRNGETLPYGSGDITGIVVHENYTSFEKDGNIGRYQLRHLLREEIDLKPDFADNFSGLITEFRYAKFPGEFEETVLEDPILATKGNGELCHTHGPVVYVENKDSYFYIGECGSKKTGRYKEGAGIELDEGGIYQPWVDNHTESAQNTDGKGWFKASLMLSWTNKDWWDSDHNRGYCWLVNFSTKGITSDKVSMQFAMYNTSTAARSPRYWIAQYSLTTIDTSAESDPEWKEIGKFVVPDIVRWGDAGNGVDGYQTAGTRVYDFPLPTEILDKESVSIRLMPRDNKAGEAKVDSYDNTTIKNGTGFNTMDYFAVRYNK